MEQIDRLFKNDCNLKEIRLNICAKGIKYLSEALKMNTVLTNKSFDLKI